MSSLAFSITPQPTETSCGPACLHAVYRYWRDAIPLDQLIDEVEDLPGGGTLAVYLGLHALRRGYSATIYTCDLHLFDPSWFEPGAPPMRDRLLAQMAVKGDGKFAATTRGYVDFLDAGGQVRMQDLAIELFAEALDAGKPIIVGLNSTWLYRCKRERSSDMKPDDVAGEPQGHFVVVHGLDDAGGAVQVADPFLNLPMPGSHDYSVDLDRLVAAILLGIVTYDAKLLIISPPDR